MASIELFPDARHRLQQAARVSRVGSLVSVGGAVYAVAVDTGLVCQAAIGHCDQPLAVGLPLDRLAQWMDAVDTPPTRARVENARLVVDAGRDNVRVALQPAGGSPVVGQFEIVAELAPDAVADLLWAAGVVSEDEPRAVFRCAHVVVASDALRITTTDGYRLHTAAVSVAYGGSARAFVVSTRALRSALQALRRAERVVVAAIDSNLALSDGSSQYVLDAQTIQYPDYAPFVNEARAASYVTVDADVLRNKLRACLAVSRPLSFVRFATDDAGVLCLHASGDHGSISTALIPHPPIDLTLNAEYLGNALRGASGEVELALQINQPSYVRFGARVAAIMPLRR